MTSVAPDLTAPSASERAAPGVAGEVVLAAVLLAMAAVPALIILPHDRVAFDGSLPLLGWFPIGVAGIVVLDRRPRSLVGWACVAAAATPVITLAWTIGRLDTGVGTVALREAVSDLGPVVLVPLALLPLAAWLDRDGTRADRRWCFWITAACTATLVAATVSWVTGSPAGYAIVATLGFGWVTATVIASAMWPAPRPVDEPLVDVGLVVGVVALAAMAGGLLRLVAQHERIFGGDVVAAIAAATTMALAVPGAWWLRNDLRTRRYGSGVLSAADVAEITADLRDEADPLELLAKAARMVTATSASQSAQIVLDDLEAPPGWACYPLVVGDATVGTLLVEPSHPEGLEVRQERIVAQLLPTVALVARAVTLAVDAGHARTDVALERDHERARILADLHDDLGPVLAGMSMRLAATRALHPSPDLDVLADDLAQCRADLRRIVAGLTPPALTNGDASTAIGDLVRSFSTERGPNVVLGAPVPDDLEPASAVVIYRTIAEGLANALRHARAQCVVVQVERRDDHLHTTVTDDGRSTVVVPGVGLTSLRVRAEELGGSLAVESLSPNGTRLHLTLPVVGP